MGILITGGASGLGEAITKRMAVGFPQEKIYITYNRSGADAAKLSEIHPQIKGIHCDFSNEVELEKLCQFIGENGIDILIHNAFQGISIAHFHKVPQKDFTDGFRRNVLPVLLITQAFIAAARKRGSGKIITVLTSSRYGAPPFGYSNYVAEKSYLYAMHKSWVSENASFNITSNCISPGFMLTAINKETDERIVEGMISKHPLKKLLTIEETADMVFSIASASQQLNGQDIILDSSQRMT